MARIKINEAEKYIFKTNIAVRITDINYGNHLGNDNLLSLIHEARLQFLNNYNYSELDIEGLGLIMSDSAINYMNESTYGDVLNFEIGISDISKIGFDLVYKISNQSKIQIALAKTGMVFFNYNEKKISFMPEKFRKKFE